jgi:L-ascorbate metabolism protein UlaG (beta-lactamase superfamily)
MISPADFAWPTPAVNGDAAPRVTLRWFGTAGFELVHGGTTILIDPYLSRVSLPRFLFAPLRPDERLVARVIERADAIFVGHSHFDHVLDVPLIAQRTGAPVYGSRSTAALLRASSVARGQIHECHGGEVIEVGPFRICMVPSEHSRFGLGGTVPFAGDIPCTCELPLHGREYRCGQVFGLAIAVAGLRLYHAGSANLIDDAIAEHDVDVFLMGISGRFATERYIPRVLRRLAPRLVVPMHYDNFFRPLDSPMRLLPRTRFGEFSEEVFQFDREISIRTLEIGQRVAVSS